jgi:hypothetical protein
MTYSVIWLSEAMTGYRLLRAADPDGAKRIAKAIAAGSVVAPRVGHRAVRWPEMSVGQGSMGAWQKSLR